MNYVGILLIVFAFIFFLIGALDEEYDGWTNREREYFFKGAFLCFVCFMLLVFGVLILCF